MLTTVLLPQFFSWLFFLFLLQAVDAKYAEVGATVGPRQYVIFEMEAITLDIPVEGIVLEDGWTITPYTLPGVSLH